MVTFAAGLHVSTQGMEVQYTDNEKANTLLTAPMASAQNRVRLSFLAPHTLLYETTRTSDNSRSRLLAYATPTVPGRCFTVAYNYDTRRLVFACTI